MTRRRVRKTNGNNLLGAMARKLLTFQDLWGYRSKTLTAAEDLDVILGSVTSLPLPFWRENFFFKGMTDRRMAEETHGGFPAVPKKKGTHPVFALKPVLNHIGFVVCPCSSQHQDTHVPWVEKGTRLLHTNREMDKRSYLVTHIRFNMPSSMAAQLHFQGEVPRDAVKSAPRKVKGY